MEQKKLICTDCGKRPMFTGGRCIQCLQEHERQVAAVNRALQRHHPA